MVTRVGGKDCYDKYVDKLPLSMESMYGNKSQAAKMASDMVTGAKDNVKIMIAWHV